MVTLPKLRSENARRMIGSIYRICMYGDGTVKEDDIWKVRHKLKPSYLKSSWIKFNHFGLNQIKIENAFIMFGAKAAELGIDVILTALASPTGIGKAQVVGLAVDLAKTIVTPIPKLLLKEYTERKFDREYFGDSSTRGKEIVAALIDHLNKIQEEARTSESKDTFVAVTSHTPNFEIKTEHINFIIKFSELPLLKYIFFNHQIAKELFLYKKNIRALDSFDFQNYGDSVNYFKNIFRILRFFHTSEVHALNFYFNSAFEKIIDFNLNYTLIHKKFVQTFYNGTRYRPLPNIKFLLKHVAHKQRASSSSSTSDESTSEIISLFNHFYLPILLNTTESPELLVRHFDDLEIQELLKDPYYNDEVRLGDVYTIAFNKLKEQLSTPIGTHLTDPLRRRAGGILNIILENITSVSAPDKGSRIKGALTITGLGVGLGCIIAGGVIGYKNKEKLSHFAKSAYEKVVVPVKDFIEKIEQNFSYMLCSERRVTSPEISRVLGSTLFIFSHILNISKVGNIPSFIRDIFGFNPISAYIIRQTERYTKLRLDMKDLKCLLVIDSFMRLGFDREHNITIKINDGCDNWTEDYDVTGLGEERLVFITKNFARVVRHKHMYMGFLLQNIHELDKELYEFERFSSTDVLYTGRGLKGAEYIAPMCRITREFTSNDIEEAARRRFFDILIERQTALMHVINCTYYIRLYNLFVSKLKEQCKDIFTNHLPVAMQRVDHEFIYRSTRVTTDGSKFRTIKDHDRASEDEKLLEYLDLLQKSMIMM